MIVVCKDKIFPYNSGCFKVGMSDGVRTIVGTNGLKGAYTRIIIHCKVCAEDPELFGEGYFEVSRTNAKDFKGCGCSGRFSPEQKLIIAKRLIKEEGYTFRGVVEEGTFTSGSYLKLTCPEGFEYDTTTISKFVDCGRRCPHCAGNIPWDTNRFMEEVKDIHKGKYEYRGTENIINSKTRFKAVCSDHGEWETDSHHHINRKQGCPHPECCWTKISEVKASNTEDFINKAIKIHCDKYNYSSTKYHRSFTKVLIGCNKCGEEFKQTASDHLSGYGCPYCAGKNQKELYIFKIFDGEIPIAIKAGIAVNHKTRLRQQQSKTCYDLELITVFTFNEVEDCKNAESECKAKLNRGVLAKQEYRDGYMETYSVNDLDKIKVIALQYNEVEYEL